MTSAEAISTAADRLANRSHNQLSSLSGIPESVRMLAVAHNLLTGVTSFSHLQNIERLDIGHNDIDSLIQLQCLWNLRELRADGNRITGIDGLQNLEALSKLNLHGNQIQQVDFSNVRWPRLEMLNLSGNRLTGTLNLASSLPGLVGLNIDNNQVDRLEPTGLMPLLRIIRASGNPIQYLSTVPWPNFRTLYVGTTRLILSQKQND
ncbi:outer arm dynein light chain 1 [Rhizopogon salebrosus TDB-379]|nr:outer arm dynein light chain 1 [Rhizopogon salebrosus TDB-379]